MIEKLITSHWVAVVAVKGPKSVLCFYNNNADNYPSSVILKQNFDTFEMFFMSRNTSVFPKKYPLPCLISEIEGKVWLAF